MPLQRIPTAKGLHTAPNSLLIQEIVCRRVGTKSPISGFADEDPLASPALLGILVESPLMGLHMALEVGEPPVPLHPAAHATNEVVEIVGVFNALDLGDRCLFVA
jgi:hypothetical protein